MQRNESPLITIHQLREISNEIKSKVSTKLRKFFTEDTAVNKCLDALVDKHAHYAHDYQVPCAELYPLFLITTPVKRHPASVLLRNANHPLFNNICESLNAAKLLNDETFAEIYPRRFSERNLKRINSVIQVLANQRQLNQDTFMLALNFINAKMPTVNESSAVEMKSGTRAILREFVIDDKVRVFKEDKCSKVSRGFSDERNTKPTYVFKRYDTRRSEQDAEYRREAKSNRLLNREAYFFKDSFDKYNLVTTWMRGDALHEISTFDLNKLPFKVKLQALSVALSELNTLHEHYRVHGDIGPTNCALDITIPALHLIDFGSMHKPHTKRNPPANPTFSEPGSDDYYFQKDMYSMSTVVRELFEDFFMSFIPVHGPSRCMYEQNKDFEAQKHAVKKLIRTMSNDDIQTRCTSAEAYQFCVQLVECKETLTIEVVDRIAAGTIENKIFDVESALRGCQKNMRR